MNRKTFSLVLVFGLTLLLATSAMASAGIAAKAVIPFAFQVGKVTLPAGTYTVERHGLSSILAFTDENGKKAMFMTNGMSAAWPIGESRLVFEHSGDQYVLSEASVGGQVGRLPVKEKTLRGQPVLVSLATY